MYCTKCGAQNPANGIYSNSCGTKLINHTALFTPESVSTPSPQLSRPPFPENSLLSTRSTDSGQAICPVSPPQQKIVPQHFQNQADQPTTRPSRTPLIPQKATMDNATRMRAIRILRTYAGYGSYRRNMVDGESGQSS
jgi:hypothetical protein